MNTNDHKLQRLLEQVTAPGDSPLSDECRSEADAESLREAWLAFGQRLHAAEASVQTPLPRWTAPQADEPKADRPNRRPSRRWLPAMIVALAASLLAVAAIRWTLHTTVGFLDSQVAEQTKPNQPVVAAVAATQPNQSQPTASAAVDESQWEDTFDEQAARIKESIAYAQLDRSLDSSSISTIRYEVEQLQQETQNGKF